MRARPVNCDQSDLINASISDVDYNGLVSIISLMSVNSSVSHTRGSYTSYFTSHMSNSFRMWIFENDKKLLYGEI